jgi:hypothetical protein
MPIFVCFFGVATTNASFLLRAGVPAFGAVAFIGKTFCLWLNGNGM